MDCLGGAEDRTLREEEGQAVARFQCSVGKEYKERS